MKTLSKMTMVIAFLSMIVACNEIHAQAIKKKEASKWPNGAQLVISISMQFEAGAQPTDADSPFPKIVLPKGQPDPVAESWYSYGAKEGVYRMLALWKKYNITVTSHVVGAAAEKFPDVAKAIAAAGHEIAGHGMTWSDQYNMGFDQELQFIKDGTDAVERITGQKAVGYNANWLRRSPNTLKALQQLGYIYHIDDLSRDEPFITVVNGKNFIVIPYTLRNNDIMSIEGRQWTPNQFLEQLKLEFDQLYAEGATRRRMMSISLHDRIGGTPAMTKVIEEFIKYTKSKPSVVYMRKIDIADLIKNDPKTPLDNSEETINN